MQPHVGFSAHSASQLHAAPPLTFSSQYQPEGQMPLPHLLHVPSSQFGPFDFSGVAWLALDDSSSLSPLACLPSLSLEFEEPVSASAADLGPPLVALSLPH